LNPRKRISLDERHSLTVYSRNMHNDSDLYNGNDSDDDMYARKRRRPRHLRSHLDRIERRTALSLRPISQKCYADSLSGKLRFHSSKIVHCLISEHWISVIQMLGATIVMSSQYMRTAD
jgi:hypothetical protein